MPTLTSYFGFLLVILTITSALFLVSIRYDLFEMS